MKKKIETKRLLLTEWEDTDECVKGLYDWASNPDVGPRAGWAPHASLEDSRKIINNIFSESYVAFAIREKESGKIIGNISLDKDGVREGVKSMELGYALSKDEWDKGYMTEAAMAVIDFAFTIYGLTILSIKTSEVNKRSQGVIENCGFKFEGVFRKSYHIYDGTDRDSRFYSLTREEWESMRSKRI